MIIVCCDKGKINLQKTYSPCKNKISFHFRLIANYFPVITKYFTVIASYLNVIASY